MARPRKIVKRVTIIIQADVSPTMLTEIKADLVNKAKELVGGELIYLAVDSDTKE